ncbi:Trimethyllysine dioxygenase [Penicillium macrosclerotiorum]|uniref:Trimethyllysine dioxygenase n=1 Tax=Penicillium macrosclerotiorum TaxID=303699 RepID=UPI0025471871|nr:Trimethyllysine dioxygenase [Penicillium macrosclerotiorum]KAJ5679098.1 Trimethyllysine dioxygenase [Penicillium macrosclerotiorum]
MNSGKAFGYRHAVLLITKNAPGWSSPVNRRLLYNSVAPKQEIQETHNSSKKVSSASIKKAALAAMNNGNVVIEIDPDHGKFLQFGNIFLRENCQCPQCTHPDTKQRIVDTFSIPSDVKSDRIVNSPTDVTIKWSDGHISSYPRDWLSSHLGPKNPSPSKAESQVNRAKAPRSFTAYDPSKGEPYPEVAYEAVMSKDASVLEWLEKIWKWGFCFIKGVPVDPASTKTLIERIAFIRHTHYGGFWDFTADLTFKDTAYTTEFLGAHTDNTYFTDPARLQLFHLLSHKDGQGGESLLVDGFAAAQQLLAENPRHYAVLNTYRHPWHASGNEDVCVQPSAMAPVLSIHPDMDRVYQIRWNNYDRAPKTDWGLGEQKDWYRAAQHYNTILTKKSNEIWTQLKPGTALIFDNWRMLHGRAEFTGKRRMCGGYVNNDDFISRLRLLKYGREKVLKNLGNFRLGRNPSQNPYSIY